MNRAGWVVLILVVLVSGVLALFTPQSILFALFAVAVIVGVSRIPSRG